MAGGEFASRLLSTQIKQKENIMKKIISTLMLVFIANIAVAEISSEEDTFFANKMTNQSRSFESVLMMSKNDGQSKWIYEQEEH